MLFVKEYDSIVFSEGDRFPLTERYRKKMTITVNGMTKLEVVSTEGGKTTFAEHYANWETGNTFTVSAGASEDAVVEAYRKAFPA